jgi:hypothetical protein
MNYYYSLYSNFEALINKKKIKKHKLNEQKKKDLKVEASESVL